MRRGPRRQSRIGPTTINRAVREFWVCATSHLLARGVYAPVPPGTDGTKYQSDRFLTAVVLRPDAVFSHNSALKLLGAAHFEWRLNTAYSQRCSQPFNLDGLGLRILSHPQRLVRRQVADVGTRTVHRIDRWLRATGSEQTLLDGVRRSGRGACRVCRLGGSRSVVVRLGTTAGAYGMVASALLSQGTCRSDQQQLYGPGPGWVLVCCSITAEMFVSSAENPLKLILSACGRITL